MSSCCKCGATLAQLGVALVELETSTGKTKICLGCLGERVAGAVDRAIDALRQGCVDTTKLRSPNNMPPFRRPSRT